MEGIDCEVDAFFFCYMDIKWKGNGVNLDNSIDKTMKMRYS